MCVAITVPAVNLRKNLGHTVTTQSPVTLKSEHCHFEVSLGQARLRNPFLGVVDLKLD